MSRILLNGLACLAFVCMVSCRSGEPTFGVPLVSLIVVPERHVGQRISVRGYLGPHMSLYLNELSVELFDTASSVMVIDQTEDGAFSLSCEGRYVELTGRFVLFQGIYAIEEVTEARALESGDYCWVAG